MQQAQLNRPSLWTSDPKQAEKQEAIRLDLLKKSPTFGFNNVIADWTFLNFLQYYGDTPYEKKLATLSALNTSTSSRAWTRASKIFTCSCPVHFPTN